MLDPAGVDVVTTWTGAAGTLSYGAYLLRHRTRSPLESRALFLLAALGALLAVRGLVWLEIGGAALLVLTFVPATLLPLAMCLFTEGLLRRHLPRWMKTFAAGSSAVFLPLVVTGLLWRHPLLPVAFLASLVGVMACLGGFLLARRRDTLSPAENRLVRGVLIAVAFGIPLAVTDFRVDLGWPSQRWGAVAVLAFVYTLARMTELREGRSWVAMEIPWLAAKTGALAALVMLLGGADATAGRVLPAATALVLLFALWERLRALVALRRERGLLRWLADAPADSLASFLAALREYPLTEQHLLLGPRELEGYRADALVRLFGGRRRVCSASQLRQARASARGEALDAAEQMLDALGRHQMTHACLLSAEPPRLLLVHLPEIAGTPDAELELEVIQRQGRLALAAEGACG